MPSRAAQMLVEQEDSSRRFLKKRIMELDEDRKQGRREVYLQIDDYQRLLVENLGLHERLDRLEEMMGMSYRYSMPKMWGFDPSPMQRTLEPGGPGNE